MIRKEVKIHVPGGVEASPAALLVQTANKFQSSIYLEAGNHKVNAKSIMGMMTIAMNYEDTITIITDGEDEAAAAEVIEKFLAHQNSNI